MCTSATSRAAARTCTDDRFAPPSPAFATLKDPLSTPRATTSGPTATGRTTARSTRSSAWPPSAPLFFAEPGTRSAAAPSGRRPARLPRERPLDRVPCGFATLHVIGSNNGLAPWTGLGFADPDAGAGRRGRQARIDATLPWIDATFDAGGGSGDLAAWCSPCRPTPVPDSDSRPAGDRRAHRPAHRRLRRGGAALQGDSHKYMADDPLGSTTSPASSCTARRCPSSTSASPSTPTPSAVQLGTSPDPVGPANVAQPERSPTAEDVPQRTDGAPPGGEQQHRWIRTVPHAGWFVHFRVDGPTQGAFDGTWKPCDFERIDRPQREPGRVPEHGSAASSALSAWRHGTPTVHLSCRLGIRIRRGATADRRVRYRRVEVRTELSRRRWHSSPPADTGVALGAVPAAWRTTRRPWPRQPSARRSPAPASRSTHPSAGAVGADCLQPASGRTDGRPVDGLRPRPSTASARVHT